MIPSLVETVAGELDRAGVRYVLIGAAALAVHGVARSTFDVDLLTTDRRTLEEGTWTRLTAGGGTSVAVRRGDADDPFAGVVRIEAAGERNVDVLVGRLAWQADIVARAQPITLHDVRMPVVRRADLTLLKLYAGGTQDAWDIEQLLSGGARQELIAQVESHLALLPADARALWRRILGRD